MIHSMAMKEMTRLRAVAVMMRASGRGDPGAAIRFEAALGHETITELTIDERVNAARARRPGHVSPSFGTIAGFNANGALPHYRATPAAHAVIEGKGLLLIDSGGQYLGGTTDITRVWPIGTIRAEHKRDFTRVLQGMINLSRARFPVRSKRRVPTSSSRALMAWLTADWVRNKSFAAKVKLPRRASMVKASSCRLSRIDFMDETRSSR